MPECKGKTCKGTKCRLHAARSYCRFHSKSAKTRTRGKRHAGRQEETEKDASSPVLTNASFECPEMSKLLKRPEAERLVVLLDMGYDAETASKMSTQELCSHLTRGIILKSALGACANKIKNETTKEQLVHMMHALHGTPLQALREMTHDQLCGLATISQSPQSWLPKFAGKALAAFKKVPWKTLIPAGVAGALAFTDLMAELIRRTEIANGGVTVTYLANSAAGQKLKAIMGAVGFDRLSGFGSRRPRGGGRGSRVRTR
eukprot:jgi/Mesvir1/18310/Mv18463-RA.1